MTLLPVLPSTKSSTPTRPVLSVLLPKKVNNVARTMAAQTVLFCAEVSGWLVVPMMLSIFLDALLRSLFNVALIGIVESNSLLLVALVYLGIAGAQASGANFRLTLLTAR